MGNVSVNHGGERIQDGVIGPRSTNLLGSRGSVYRMFRRRA
jgi:hypothetical protein